MLDEQRLLEQADAWDIDALAAIYDAFAGRIYQYIYRYLGEVRLTEDLTAEVFARLLHATQQGKGPQRNLSAWLYRVAHNLVVDHFRQKTRSEGVPLEEGLLAAPDDPTALVHKRLVQQQLREAICLLTEEQQQVIVLKFIEGFSNQEVSRILKKSVGAVKSLQHRALASLRRVLEEQGQMEPTSVLGSNGDTEGGDSADEQE
ncbi:MAG: sigma-70 family RNA polymerase sigma factor [Chloroflexi bacterium]|nr:sigma-70 family RNA polymerase sigma factor [Chloroflexota bacterium]